MILFRAVSTSIAFGDCNDDVDKQRGDHRRRRRPRGLPLALSLALSLGSASSDLSAISLGSGPFSTATSDAGGSSIEKD